MNESNFFFNLFIIWLPQHFVVESFEIKLSVALGRKGSRLFVFSKLPSYFEYKYKKYKPLKPLKVFHAQPEPAIFLMLKFYIWLSRTQD